MHVLGYFDSPDSFGHQCLGDRPLLCLSLQILANGGHRLLQLRLGNIVEGDGKTELGKNVGNAVTHLTCAEHSNSFDHSELS